MTKGLIEKLEELKSNDTDWDTSYWNQSIERCINIIYQHFASPELVKRVADRIDEGYSKGGELTANELAKIAIEAVMSNSTCIAGEEAGKAASGDESPLLASLGGASHEGGITHERDAALQPSPASQHIIEKAAQAATAAAEAKYLPVIDLVDEYLHWRKVNPHIKGGENYLKRLREALVGTHSTTSKG